MSFQFAGLGAGVVTEVTLEWLFPRVASPVDYKVALELEGLPAELARLGLERGAWLGCVGYGIGGGA